MGPTDKILATAKERFSSAFGDGATAINWQAILAALMSVLSGCVVAVTPANVKAQAKRPLVLLKLYRRFRGDGLSVSDSSRAANAVAAVVYKATDEEINTFAQAADESA